ncbi:hypothetical protein RCL1_008911 [Eukaryota sp. TZLM3-RCL]
MKLLFILIITVILVSATSKPIGDALCKLFDQDSYCKSYQTGPGGVVCQGLDIPCDGSPVCKKVNVFDKLHGSARWKGREKHNDAWIVMNAGKLEGFFHHVSNEVKFSGSINAKGHVELTTKALKHYKGTMFLSPDTDELVLGLRSKTNDRLEFKLLFWCKYYEEKKHECKEDFEMEKRNFKTFERLAKSVVYPESLEIASTQTPPPGLLAEGVKGRVDITTTFQGFELNVEYIWGVLSIGQHPILGPLSPFNAFESYEIMGFASSGNVASGVVLFKHIAGPGTSVVNLFLRINDEGEIEAYDAIFVRQYPFFRFGARARIDALPPAELAQLMALSGVSQEMMDECPNDSLLKLSQQSFARFVCTAHEVYCKAEYDQFPNNDCFSVYGGPNPIVPLGHFDEVHSNTTICRAIHAAMTPYAPAVHCPHLAIDTHVCMNENPFVYVAQFTDYFERNTFIPECLKDKV